jgi:hypothetical protein
VHASHQRAGQWSLRGVWIILPEGQNNEQMGLKIILPGGHDGLIIYPKQLRHRRFLSLVPKRGEGKQ